MKSIARFAFLAASLYLSGCTIIQPVEMPAGHYFIDPQTNFNTLSKIVVLELKNLSPNSDQAQMLTSALADGLGKKHLFSVQCIYQNDPVWDQLGMDSVSEYTNPQLAEMRKQLGVDAVLFGTINRYSSYPHFLVGLNLKMVDLRNSRLIWAIEEIWDSTDRNVEQRMQEFFRNEMRDSYQPMNWELLVTSPRHFNKFVVFEITQTLPRVIAQGNFYSSSENQRGFSSFSKYFMKIGKKD